MKTPVAFTRKSPVAVRIPAFVTVPESMLIFFANISFSAPFVNLADSILISAFDESIFPSFVKTPVAFTSTPTAKIFPAFVKLITGFTSNLPVVTVICELFAKLFFTFALKFPEVTSIVPLFSKSVVAFTSNSEAIIIPLFSKSVAVVTTSFPVNMFSEFSPKRIFASVVSSSPFCASISPEFVIDVAVIDKSPVELRFPVLSKVETSKRIVPAEISFSTVQFWDFMFNSLPTSTLP